jgi:radical S-adenosyl methionine domain-containing protein 2
LTTALVTNGSLLDGPTIERLRGILDWVTISIDSVRPRSLELLGRRTGGRAINEHGYRALCHAVRTSGIRLKINTVVTAVNWHEDMSEFIIAARPERWKILQVLPVPGQNSRKVDPLIITSRQFEDFVARHLRVEFHGIRVIPEDNDAMTGSYAMVDPAGRFFDAVDPRGYTYSEPILQVGVPRAISQIVISREKFLARGGLYDDDADPVGVR